jgi:DNA invertase Pin-like site-specific DNA recombinase
MRMEGQPFQATSNTPVEVRKIFRERTLTQVRAKRVAAYCRVSTVLEQQQSSLETQMEAFNDMIARHADWELAGIYTDEETGTSRRNRDGFNSLMADAEAGKIDIILVKSVQRFARNTVDALTATRRLKALGVSVYFERDNINTSQATSELYLTLMAAVAQEESHSLSENMKWGIRKRFAAGIPRWSATYGYRKTEEGDWVVDEVEAVQVRRIFDMYKNGSGLPSIVTALEQDGVITQTGKTKWYPHTITLMLKNEKYIGDVRMQKDYTADHLSHRRVKNRDLLVPQYYIHDHHPPIIDRETFAIVQRIAVLCDPHRGSTQYPYYGFLRCPHCGQLMIRFQHPGHFSKDKEWACGGAAGHEKRGDRTSCMPQSIGEGYIHEAFWQAFDDLDEGQLLTISQGDGEEAKGASFALEAKQYDRARLVGKRNVPSYHLLAKTIQSISFSEDYRTLLVTWNFGLVSCIDIRYHWPWHRPASVLTYSGGRFRIDGKPICSGKQVAASLKAKITYIDAIRIVDPSEDDEQQIPNVYPPLSKKHNSNEEEACELQG